MASQISSQGQVVPILLLKTRSTPGDAYQDKLAGAALTSGRRFLPVFVPVLRHSFYDSGIKKLREQLHEGRISHKPEATYGGLVFTSQRAVEAFAQVVNESKARKAQGWPCLQGIPVYSVGPATTRALGAVSQTPALQIFGEHTGNGEALAHYMLDHYGEWYRSRLSKPTLLFLVGEQRRDVIPRTLMDPTLAADRRITVTEEVVYGTSIMESFPADLEAALIEGALAPRLWIVVFSPTGCDGMLHRLGLLDGAGKAMPGKRDGRTFIAAIGPTTRDFLINTFGFEPDVCAAKPNPDGVLDAILEHEARKSY